MNLANNPIVTALVIKLLVLFCLVSSLWATEEPPNIVILLSDDQAWSDYGFMGHSEIETPCLDALARQSILFKRGYVASPLCRPSLASIVTGLYPFQHGITGNDVDGGNQRAALDKPVQAAFHQLPSIIGLLTDNGYLAHQSGKWWEGSWRDGGFTDGMTHGDPARGGRHGDAGLEIGRKTMQPIKQFIDDALQQKKPFLVWYAPFLPHAPHNPPPRLLEKYQRPGRAADVSKYYAMCQWSDETCGELIDYLEEKKIRRQTLVIYLCDNGWAAASTNAQDPNQKLWKRFAQRSKGSPYEKGIRTPILLSWPGRLTPGRDPNLAQSIDLFPTIAAAAGLKPPSNLPGVNLLDQVACSNRQTAMGVCHSIHNMTPGDPDDTLQYLWCVEGDWKLLVRYSGKDTTQYRKLHIWDTAPVRLYNLSVDPEETNDCSAEFPDVVKRLTEKIEDFRPVGAQFTK